MISVYFFKILRLLPLLALPFLAWLMPPAAEKKPENFSSEKVNLALRRTADGLLRQSGDSTSRIPAIEQSGAGVWRVRLKQPFRYEQLPALLQASLDLYGIQRPYQVAVRRCADSTIDLGYHQLDFLQKNAVPPEGREVPGGYHQLDFSQNNAVPCGGREMPEGCHYIEITFLDSGGSGSFWAGKSGIILLILAGLVGLWFFRRQKPAPAAAEVTAEETAWLEFGNSRLDVAGQVLICGDVRQTLTFRETKLLRLFATRPDQLLERDFILRQVWADEGILVGRSVDVFVSRLRKKLAADPSVGIVAVHGVGYRLETGKSA
ncbi:MAG: winged helix-turn-helix domain-containing protein [Saprospiraceae bacterium]